MKPYQYFPSLVWRVFPRGPRCCLSWNQHHLWLPKAAGAELLSQVYLVAGGHCGAQVGVTQCWSMDRKDGHPLVGQLRLEWILLEATWTSLAQVRGDAAPTGAQTAPQAAGSPQCLRISACYTGDPFPKPLWPKGLLEMPVVSAGLGLGAAVMSQECHTLLGSDARSRTERGFTQQVFTQHFSQMEECPAQLFHPLSCQWGSGCYIQRKIVLIISF